MNAKCTEYIHNLNWEDSLVQVQGDWRRHAVQPIFSNIVLPGNVCIHGADHLSLESFVAEIYAISTGSWINTMTPVRKVNKQIIKLECEYTYEVF